MSLIEKIKNLLNTDLIAIGVKLWGLEKEVGSEAPIETSTGELPKPTSTLPSKTPEPKQETILQELPTITHTLPSSTVTPTIPSLAPIPSEGSHINVIPVKTTTTIAVGMKEVGGVAIPTGSTGVIGLPSNASAEVIAEAKALNPEATIQIGTTIVQEKPSVSVRKAPSGEISRVSISMDQVQKSGDIYTAVQQSTGVDRATAQKMVSDGTVAVY